MGKLIMWNIITLDGFFEGDNHWDLTFHEKIWGEELQQLSIEQLKSAGSLLFGRITYEGMAAHWTSQKDEIADFMNTIPKFVASRTLTSVEWNNSSLLKDEVTSEILALKAQTKGDIYVFGSANLSQTLIQHKLFDEFRIGISPVLLGSGRPLFAANAKQVVELELLSLKSLKTGGVILTYKA